MGEVLDKTKKVLSSMALNNGECLAPTMVASWMDDNISKFELRNTKVVSCENFSAISISAESDDIVLQKEKIKSFCNISSVCDEFIFSRVDSGTLKIEFIIRLKDILGETNEQS